MFTRIIESVASSLINRASTKYLNDHQELETKSKDQPEGVVLGHKIPDFISLPHQRSRCAAPVVISDIERLKHLYITGSTGSGKTNTLLQLIKADIESQHSFCVIDPQGDFVDRTLLQIASLKEAEELSQKLLLIDLRERESFVAFNPLTGEDEPFSRALHLLGAIRKHADSWGVQLEETLRYSLLALAEMGFSLLDLDPLLRNATFRRSIIKRIKDQSVRSFFENYDALSDDKRLAWSLPVLNKVSPLLAAPPVRNILGQRNSISLSEIFNSPDKIVLVALGVDKLHQAGYLFGSFFLSALQSVIMSRADMPEASRIPVHLYIDEFEMIASDTFEALIAQARRFGLGLTLSHQNLSQISSSLRHVIRNNAGTQLFFQTGSLDAAELAREIIAPESLLDVRTTLMTQVAGQAFMVRRGNPAERIRVLHCPDPTIDHSRVSSIKKQSLSEFSTPRRIIEEELFSRHSSFTAEVIARNNFSPSPPEVQHEVSPKMNTKSKSFPRYKRKTNDS